MPTLNYLFSAQFDPKLQKKSMKTPRINSIGRSLLEIRARLATLTRHEQEVLEYVVARKLKEQIAGELGSTEQTVKFHRGHIMRKMQAVSLADLVRMAASLSSPPVRPPFR